MSDKRVEKAGLQIGEELHRVLVDEALPGTGVDPERFFEGLARLVAELGPRNDELLEERERLQAAIDGWHRDRAGEPHDADAYRAFLEEVGYLVPPGPDFTIEVTGVDPEIATIPGPQLVVPVTNARYALNAANARWGSLYDALYGTDAMGDGPPPGPYDPVRGDRVIAWVRDLLDELLPLAAGSHTEVTAYRVAGGHLVAERGDDEPTTLADPARLSGFTGPADEPTSVLFDHHSLGIEVVIDRAHDVGATDKAGVADVVLESAVTAIVDCEDSVAAVDSADKALAYRNWLGLLRGDLTEQVTKAGATFTRRLADDKTFTALDGTSFTRPGRALLLSRNVGHLMATPAVLDSAGNPIPEGLLDALVTVLCAMHDRPDGPGGRRGRCRRAAELDDRIGLRGQAEDARSRRGGVRLPGVRRGRDDLGASGQHGEDRDHGRGAAGRPSTSRRASRRHRPGCASSTPASSTARATRSTPRCWPGRWSARAT